ncbi:MAG TPA: thiaminase II [Acetobacteraceae bacterium]|jgi:thiaminase (transcriptional activator TenA)|nr:thiaminase II [Acetobacteraceae bacterium]
MTDPIAASGGFPDAAWARTARLRAAIDALPFNRELADGTLSRARFGFYITQDALYLGQYARILALAGARGPDGPVLHAFASSALEAVAVEQALHEQYLTQFGVDAAQLAAAEPSPDCLGYTSFLLATAYHEPWEVLVAALLPCFWIYWDVGNSIAQRAAADNPYRAWIDTYSDAAFGAAVRTVIGITDRAAAGTTSGVRDRMMGAFVRSSQFEWLFWDSAYQQRGWPEV